MARSADVVTASVSVALSFAGLASTAGDDVIEAVFASVARAYPGATASVSWYETPPPTAIGADVVKVNVPAAIVQSASASLPTVPAGMVSEMTTPAGICDGPLFVAVMV